MEEEKTVEEIKVQDSGIQIDTTCISCGRPFSYIRAPKSRGAIRSFCTVCKKARISLRCSGWHGSKNQNTSNITYTKPVEIKEKFEYETMAWDNPSVY